MAESQRRKCSRFRHNAGAGNARVLRPGDGSRRTSQTPRCSQTRSTPGSVPRSPPCAPRRRSARAGTRHRRSPAHRCPPADLSTEQRRRILCAPRLLRSRPSARVLPQPVLELCSLPRSGEPPGVAATCPAGVYRCSVRHPDWASIREDPGSRRSRALTGSVSIVPDQLAPSVTVTLKSVVIPSLSVTVTVTGSASSPVTLRGCRVMTFFSGLPTERVSGSETSTL